MSIKVEQLVIIGSGPAGLTAGIYAGRANLKPLILEGSNPGGQLMKTSYVENWPGEIKILGPDLMEKLKEQAIHQGANFLSQNIVKVDLGKKPFSLWTSRNQEILANSIIMATGSTPKKLNIPGEDEYWGKGVTICAVCDGAFYKDKSVVIIGGGDTAMEDASFMTKFTDKITIIHILDKLTASHAMQQRVLNNPKINIIYNSTVSQIKGNGSHITEIEIENKLNKNKEIVKADAIFLAIGSTPNTAFLGNQLELTQYGHIKLVSNNQTSISGVFAAGDVCDPRYKQAIYSAGMGCAAALDTERYLNQ